MTAFGVISIYLSRHPSPLSRRTEIIETTTTTAGAAWKKEVGVEAPVVIEVASV
jgi:hypothetical protein